MTRSQVITGLVNCLTEMGPDKGQQVAARQVSRGVRQVEELNELPSLCVFNSGVTTLDENIHASERKLEVHIWGAEEAAHGDFSDLDAFLESITAALNDSELNPHWSRTSLEEMQIYEGGPGEAVGMFDLKLSVTYSAERGEL